jgi:hypothetical protein
MPIQRKAESYDKARSKGLHESAEEPDHAWPVNVEEMK